MAEAFPLSSLELAAGLESRACVEVGERVRLRAIARNAGTDASPPCALSLAAPPALLLVSTSPYRRPVGRRSLAPHAGRELAFAIPPLLQDESFELAIDAYAISADERAAIGVRCSAAAPAEIAVPVRIVASPAFAPAANRLTFDAAEALAGATIEGCVVVTNTGSAAADPCAVHVDGDFDDVAVEELGGALAPQERRIVRVVARVPRECPDGSVLRAVAGVASGGTLHRIGEARVVARGRARFAGRIDAGAACVRSGEEIGWTLRVTNDGDATAAEVRIALGCAGAVYVPGSTRLGGSILLDVHGTSPLWSSEGLAFERVAPGCAIEIACTTIADAGAPSARLWARLAHGDGETPIESAGVRVDAPDAGTPPFPFVVRGASFLPAPQPDVPAAVAPAEVRFEDARGEAVDANVVRHLGSLGGLMRHAWALGFLCADRSDDGERARRLAAARTALRSVFDRLSIKLRMPHYRIGAEDVLDPGAWDALSALDPQLDSSRLAGGLESALRAAAPAQGDPLAAAALASYRTVFARAVRDCDDRAILAALAVPQPALDEALDAVLACEADAVMA